jgi:tetratricopeptide (TPR) repeat protein
MGMSKLPVVVLFLSVAASSSTRGAESRNELAAGHHYYEAGDYKKAVSHFEQAVKADPNEADAHFWVGKSYEVIGDLNAPLFGNRALSKARASLAMAVQLAPADHEYRREFFNFLLWTYESRSALDQADRLLRALPESDPDYRSMQFELQQERDFRRSGANRLSGVFLFGPRTVVGLVDRPVGAIRNTQNAYAGTGQ